MGFFLTFSISNSSEFSIRYRPRSNLFNRDRPTPRSETNLIFFLKVLFHIIYYNYDREHDITISLNASCLSGCGTECVT